MFEIRIDEDTCHWRCKIPHFRRDKNPHLTTLKQVLECSGDAKNGGFSRDTRSLQPGDDHQSNLAGDGVQPENNTEIHHHPTTLYWIEAEQYIEQTG